MSAAHDLGNLLQTAVVLWAYVSFMQYLVIWSGDMQDDLTWFHHRTRGGWNLVTVALVTLHFGLPFVLLLFQRIKRDLGALACLACGVLVLRAVDVVWMIVPSDAGEAPARLHWLDVFAPLATGGLWWACFVWQLEDVPLVPAARRSEVVEGPDDRNDVATPATT